MIVPSISTISPALFSHQLVFTISISAFLILCAYHTYKSFYSQMFFFIYSFYLCFFFYVFCCLGCFIFYVYLIQCEVKLLSKFIVFFSNIFSLTSCVCLLTEGQTDWLTDICTSTCTYTCKLTEIWSFVELKYFFNSVVIILLVNSQIQNF